MADSILGVVSGLRWHLPVRSPSDQTVDDQRECEAIDAADSITRENPLEYPGHGKLGLPNGGEVGSEGAVPAYSPMLGEADGRAAVAAAQQPEPR
ncbi:hypothetical protein OK349_04685 [Sphingomonas sp. BT-65]|uniref:hypothetical protein n=1 Tax=Sphingomonas sp. BT-65 TaxID=2989821 RepID=UPI0022369CB8|nr:hypothetical protein [Sphingomonas sp. BT-65]MCW4460993.1 hypothetical protein [Sphingomonas sp. BT-65]